MRVLQKLWSSVGLSADTKFPLLSLCVFSALPPPPLPICWLYRYLKPFRCFSSPTLMFWSEAQGKPSHWFHRASGQFPIYFPLPSLNPSNPYNVLVQVPTSPNYKSPLNFALRWAAASHHLFILWLQSMPFVWHRKYLRFQILPHQFRINGPCLVVCIFFQSFL